MARNMRFSVAEAETVLLGHPMKMVLGASAPVVAAALEVVKAMMAWESAKANYYSAEEEGDIGDMTRWRTARQRAATALDAALDKWEE